MNNYQSYNQQKYGQQQQNNQRQQERQFSQQQSTTIQNQQSGQMPQVKGPEMNDRDRLNDLLATEKMLTDNFNVFAREASHQQLHRDVMQILNETHYVCRDAFNLMFQKGWYKLQAEEVQQISQAQQQFSNYQSQFPTNQSNMMF